MKCTRAFHLLEHLLFSEGGINIRRVKTLANFLDRMTQLYEQGADVRRIGKYVRNYCPAGGATAGSPVGGAIVGGIPGGPGGGAIPGAGAVA